MKGGLPDLERCCRVVLDEYRGGKVGRITLEAPPSKKDRKEAAAGEEGPADSAE